MHTRSLRRRSRSVLYKCPRRGTCPGHTHRGRVRPTTTAGLVLWTQGRSHTHSRTETPTRLQTLNCTLMYVRTVVPCIRDHTPGQVSFNPTSRTTHRNPTLVETKTSTGLGRLLRSFGSSDLETPQCDLHTHSGDLHKVLFDSPSS